MWQKLFGLGKACEIAKRNLEQYKLKLQTLRDYFLEEIQKNVSDFYINGNMEKRLPGNINIIFPGIDSSELLYRMDEYVHQEVLHVLLEMINHHMFYLLLEFQMN